MNWQVGLVSTVFLLSVSVSTHAQIKVVKKPATAVGPDEEVVYDSWTSSWGLRDDAPDKYPLGISTHKTEAEAVAAAKAHIAKSAGNGDLAVTHYLIEGEPSVRKKSAEQVKQAVELLERLKQAKEAVDQAKKVAKGEASVFQAKERKLGDTIKEYKDMVGQSYRQIVETKKTMTGGVASLSEAKFREVNGLIDKYNRDVQGFEGVMGGDANLGYSVMARVEPYDSQKARMEIIGTWKGNHSVAGEVKELLTLTFDENGTVTVRFQNGDVGTGTWTRAGDAVNTTFPGNYKYSWQLKNGEISGPSIRTSLGRVSWISMRKP
jgi:hypothetical protein